MYTRKLFDEASCKLKYFILELKIIKIILDHQINKFNAFLPLKDSFSFYDNLSGLIGSNEKGMSHEAFR